MRGWRAGSWRLSGVRRAVRGYRLRRAAPGPRGTRLPTPGPGRTRFLAPGPWRTRFLALDGADA